MAGFRRKSLPRLRQIQQDQAVGRLADGPRHTTAEQRGAAHERALGEAHGGMSVLAAAGVAGSTAARQVDESRFVEAVAGEVRAAEQALLLVVQARRRAESLRDRSDRSMRGLADQDDEQGLGEFASTAHSPESPVT